METNKLNKSIKHKHFPLRLNKRGGAYFYVFMLIFIMMGVTTVYSKYSMAHNNLKVKTEKKADLESFLNDMEDKAISGGDIRLDTDSVLTGKFKGKQYTLTLTPSAEIKARQVEDTYTFDRDDLQIKDTFFNSNKNFQVINFIENNQSNKTDRHILSSNLFTNNILYTGEGKAIELKDNPEYKKVGFRKNEGPMEIKTDYPSNRVLSLNDPKKGDIFNIYYMSENNQVEQRQRFTYGESIPTRSDENAYTLVSIPNKDIGIRDDIIYNYKSYNHAKLETRSDFDDELGGNTISTDITLNIVNNYSGEYQLTIIYDTYNLSSPVTHKATYSEENETYSSSSSDISNDTIQVNQTVSSNYPYTDKNKVGQSSVSSNLQKREIKVTAENALVKEVIVSYLEFKESPFKLKVFSEDGQVFRDKVVRIEQ